ncbi:MAG: xylulokinase [Actinomycetota bacterium]
MPRVVGVDSSTSACKVEVRDADDGRVLASGRAPHPPTTPPRSEQAPEAWLAAFEAAGAAAGVARDGAGAPDAIAIGGQQHGMVACAADGTVLRPAKLWNDTESAPDAEALRGALPDGAAGWARACGSVPVASFTITKVGWLRRTEPATYARLGALLLPHDWLTGRLTGGRTTDRGDASGTGWWSPAEGRYRTDLLALVDADRDWAPLLPAVLGPVDEAGRWGRAIVGPGTGDNMAAALGLGLRPGDLVLSLGTSATAFGVSERPTADAGGAVAGFADATGRYLPLVCTLNATKVTDAVARLLGVDAARLDALALEAPAGAGGLVLVPHLDGERTPDRPGATGTLAGIRSDVGRAQLARAAVEGVVCNLLAGADHLVRLDPAIGTGRTFLVGGGARSGAYRRVVADLLGRPVVVPREGELVACGAAAQAAAVLAGSTPGAVAEAWGLGAGDAVEPGPGAAVAAEVRAAYAAVAGDGRGAAPRGD